MSRLRRVAGVVLALALSAVPAVAQGTGTITGQVVDQENRTPIVGAQVAVSGTTIGTITDQQGNFTLANVPAGPQVVRASHIGYSEGTTSVTVGATPARVTLALQADVLGLDELVVVGYGTQQRRNVTGAVSTIRPSEVAADVPAASLDNVLQGRVAGVQVTQNSGTPGGAMTVRVRGSSSISAGNQPLYVVDGVPLVQGDHSTFDADWYGGQGVDALADLNPNEIESIQVLKDASAAAIYGSRASNGVVLITTKRGKAGQKPTINFSAYYGTQEAWRIPGFLNSRQYVDVQNEALVAGLGDDYAGIFGFTDDGEENYIDLDPAVNTNWLDEVMNPAPISNLSGSIAGGDEKTRYFVSGSRFNQEGIVGKQAFERLSGRLNLDYTATDRLRLGTNISLTRSLTTRQASDNNIYAAFPNAIASTPIDRVYDETGEFDLESELLPLYGFGYDNPVALGVYNYGTENSVRTIGSAFATYTLTDGVDVRGSVGLDHLNLRSMLYDSPIIGSAVGAGGEINQGNNYVTKLLYEGTLNFSRDFGLNHALSGVLGTSYEQNHRESDWLQAQSFPSETFKVPSAAANVIGAGGAPSDWNLLSFFGRASYTFAEKLTTTFNVRVDGSSRFGANNRYGVFPSASVLYRLSDEPFLQGSVVSDLALRASYGRTGNQQGIGNFASLGLLGAGYNYEDLPGLAPVQLANPDLSWEKTSQLNLGGDVAFYDNRLGLSFDWYDKNTSDLLLDRLLPLTSGFAVITSNIGSMRNRGYEIAARADLLRGGTQGLSWSAALNLSHNSNEVTELYNDQPINTGFASRVEEGQPLGVFYGYVTEGIFRSQEEIDQHATQEDGTAPGDIRFKDVNEDGVINADDRTIIGNPWPDFEGGFTNTLGFRGLDLNVFLQFSQGNDIYNGTRIYTDAYGNGPDNNSARALDRWSPSNPDGTEPRAVYGDPNDNTRDSDRWVEDGSYLRMKNVVLGYTLPSRLTRGMGVNKLRLYVQGQNLVTWTDYSGFDPEVNALGDAAVARGTDFYTLPQARTFTVGVDIGL